MMLDKIDAVTVCVGYADFLRAAAPHNAIHFNKWVIVTSPKDHDTQAVCRDLRLTCLVSDDVGRDGAFSKGRLIERGLQHLSADSWIVHLDADIVLPSRFREILNRSHLHTGKIYGCDRILVKGYEKWKDILASGWLFRSNGGYPHAVTLPDGCPLMTRWVGPDGYVPIGFFQMWHRVGGGEEVCGVRMKPYPMAHGNACRTDVQHGLQWDRRNRELLPELVVCHLESEGEYQTGVNWNGRKSRPFGPEQPILLARAPS